jgi:hypothetical protein
MNHKQISGSQPDKRYADDQRDGRAGLRTMAAGISNPRGVQRSSTVHPASPLQALR